MLPCFIRPKAQFDLISKNIKLKFFPQNKYEKYVPLYNPLTLTLIVLISKHCKVQKCTLCWPPKRSSDNYKTCFMFKQI